jgi:hypothetical protein
LLQRHRPLDVYGKDPEKTVQRRIGGKRGAGNFVVRIQYGLKFTGIFGINGGRISGAEETFFRQFGSGQRPIPPFGLAVNYGDGTVISYRKNKIFS